MSTPAATDVSIGPTGPTTILVVDDEAEIRDLLSTILTKFGYRVLTAASGREGLDLAHQHRPDLVLLDVIMPGMNGLHVCREFKADPALAGMFVMLMSGMATDLSDEIGGRECGADDYLIKPFNTALLLARVRTFDRIHQAEAALRKWNQQLEQHVAERTAALDELIAELGARISERKLAEASLRESEERYRSLVAALQEGVILRDADGVIRACNASAERILGLSRDQILGRTSLDAPWRTIHEDGTPFPSETHPPMVALATGQSQSNVLMGIHKPDGRLTWISINAEPIFRPGDSRPSAVVGTFTDITERKRAAETTQALPRRILEAQEAERERVARELHDGVGQLIASVRFRLRGLESKLSTAGLADLSRDAGQAQAHLERAMDEIRRVSRDLRPGELDDLGFLAAIHSACTEFTTRTGIEVNLESVRLPARLPREMEVALYRIVQEALANIERHAGAASVAVRLTQYGRQVLLSISDDGRGFVARQALAARTGLGLANIRERAGHLGGIAQIASQPGVGTEISVRLPLDQANSTAEHETTTKQNQTPAGG